MKFASPLKCGVPGSLLLGLLNQASGDTIEVTTGDGDSLEFKAGRSKVTLSTLPIERKVWRYPDKSTGKAVASWKVSEDFLKGLKRAFILRPSSPKRMEHHAVCIFAVDGEADAPGEMDLYVTDSRSLIVMPVGEPIKGTAKKIALPREMAEQIATRCAVGQELRMFADHFVVDASAKLRLYSNVFDTAEMLDLPAFADQHANDKTAPPFPIPADLTAALERTVLLAGAEEPTVVLTVSGKSLRLRGRFKHGEIEEEFTLPKAIAKAMLSVDAKTLLSVIGKDVKKMALGERAMNVQGEDGFIYILSSKESAATRTEEAPAEAEEDA